MNVFEINKGVLMICGKKMNMMVQKVAKEIQGESQGYIRRAKETWWQNGNVQEKV